MGLEGEGSGGKGGGKWGERGREVGLKGEGSGGWVPPCPPPQIRRNVGFGIAKTPNFRA